VLLDLGSHLVDQAYVLFGPVRSIYAELAAWRGGADDDAFLALTHEDGTRSHLWCGAVTPTEGPRLRVQGSRAALVVDGLDGQEAALRAGAPPAGAVPQTMRLVRGEETERVAPEPGGWDTFYPAVLAALRDRLPMPVAPADAVAVLRLLDAARESAATGRVVVPSGGGPSMPPPERTPSLARHDQPHPCTDR
jgi:predicted dehydrogenase